MKNVLIQIFIILIIISCKSSGNIKIYKNKEILTSGFTTNSIKDFPWKYKSNNIFDSIILNKKKEKKIYTIINNLEKIDNNENPMGTPRYAFIIKYNNKKDTLYFYDFNSELYKNEAYMIQNNITLKDTNNELKKYLFKHFKKFIKKEFYFIPSKSKERHYYLN